VLDGVEFCRSEMYLHSPEILSRPLVFPARNLECVFVCLCARVHRCTSAHARARTHTHTHTNSQRLHNMTHLKPRFGVERINHASCYMQVRSVVIKNARICEHLFSEPTNLHCLVGSLHKCKYYLYARIWNIYCDVHSQIGSFKRHNCGMYFLH